MKTALFLSTLALFSFGVQAGPVKAPENPANPPAGCPHCDRGTSRLAAMIGEEKCPADCSKLCCKGETAHFVVAGLAEAEAAAKVRDTVTALEDTTLEKICRKSSCAVIKFDPAKTTPAKVVEALGKSGIQVAGQKLHFRVQGMTCTGCSGKLSRVLAATEGVTRVETVSHEEGTAALQIDPKKTDAARITAVINGTGYKVAE